jgi:colanic acid biosynthesis glycosyl transferase WcaI
VTSRLSYDDPLARHPKREIVGGVEVIRVATTEFGRTGLVGRTVDYLTFHLSTAWALLRKARRGDVNVAMTDPPLLSVATKPIARLRGGHSVNWLQDIFPEVATRLGVAGGRGWRAPLAALR